MPTSQKTAFGTQTEARLNVLLDAMALEEQISLLAGANFWMTVPIERLGIPAIKVTDGPNGARGGGTLVGGVKAASFPVGIALASTWNTELVEQIGLASGSPRPCGRAKSAPRRCARARGACCV